MQYWIYSTVIPAVIILLFVIAFSPLTLKRLTKAIGLSLLPLLFYFLLIYYLEIEDFIDSGWAFYTVLFFFIPYIITAIILAIIVALKKQSQ